MQLKDESYLMPQQPQRAAIAADFNVVHVHQSAIGLVEAAQQMQQRALATTRRTTQGHGLAFRRREVHTLQYGDRARVVALPHILRADDGFHSKRSASTARIRIA